MINSRNHNHECFQSLSICTFNARGMRNRQKCKTILRLLKKKKYDVIALQEMHLMHNDLTLVKKNWGGHIEYAAGSNRSKGIGLLFSKKIEREQIEKVFSTDRMLLIKIKLKTDELFFCNVYAPTVDTEKIKFYSEFYDVLTAQIGEDNLDKLICLGDFNAVMDNNLDIISGLKHKKEVVNIFRDNFKRLELTDCWREDNPDTKDFSWCSGASGIARRLDYIFAGKNILPFIRNCKIESIGQSDHRAVSLNMIFFEFKRGKGIRKLNVEILKDKQFVKLTKNIIKDTKDEFMNESKSIVWEMVKIRCLEFSQKYNIRNIHERYDKEKILTKNINDLEDSFTSDFNNDALKQKIVKLKNELDLLQIQKTKDSKRRTKLTWLRDGEKCSKFFFSLEKNNIVSNTIYRLKNNEGNYIYDEHEILDSIKNYYSSLYEQRNIGNDSKYELLEKFTYDLKLNKLNDEEKTFCDQEIDIHDLENAIKNLNKGSSPGFDGLPAEFYQTFFDDIKYLLLDYYNECNDNGELSETSQIGVISLNHKGKSLERDIITNWRPITLTNTDYKIIAKVMATKIKGVLDKLVGKQQQGFLRGRNISNLIRDIDDILEYEKSKNLDDLLFAIDFKQAFDRINANYIINV